MDGIEDILSCDDIQKLAGNVTMIENLTDMGNSRRLVRQSTGNVRFLIDYGKWIVWTGKRWEIDQSGLIMRYARQAVRHIYAEASTALEENERRAIAKHAMRSEAEGRINAMVSLARTEKEIPIRLAEVDKDAWLLNCENGTIDLRTGKLRPHSKEDLITKIAPTRYSPGAKSSIFKLFLEKILPDEDTRRYVQKALGYSLTGNTGLEKLFFAYGPPATGKSTLFSAVGAVLGDYAATADFETFLQRDRVNGGPRNDLARLAGKRFVVSLEVEDGRKLAEALINAVTGCDTVTARFLYAESFEFKPQFKLWLAANNRPRVSGPESALWRRLVQLPFREVIPKQERNPEIKAKLQAEERSAVLCWLVEGCLLWQKEGLHEPHAVQKTTEEYREESDVLKEFLQDCCVLLPTAQTKNPDIWQAYQAWAKENSERYPLGRKRFSQALLARGLDQYDGATARTWIGVGLK